MLNISALVGGVVSSDFDSNLIRQVELGFVKISAVRKKYCVIAIGNHHGEIYRLIGVDSESDLAGLFKAFAPLNLCRELSDVLGFGGKYHVVLFQSGTMAAIGSRAGKSPTSMGRGL